MDRYTVDLLGGPVYPEWARVEMRVGRPDCSFVQVILASGRSGEDPGLDVSFAEPRLVVQKTKRSTREGRVEHRQCQTDLEHGERVAPGTGKALRQQGNRASALEERRGYGKNAVAMGRTLWLWEERCGYGKKVASNEIAPGPINRNIAQTTARLIVYSAPGGSFVMR